MQYAIRRARKLGHLIGAARRKTVFGYSMDLQLTDHIDQYIYATGDWEEQTSATVSALLTKGGYCVDIGANIGFFSLLMAKCVGSTGKVWSFEPHPATRQRLSRNIAINRFRNIEIRAEAISDRSGQVSLYPGSADNSGLAGFRSTGDSGAITVSTVALSSCIPSAQRVSLVKVDIEGAEALALKGMSDVLARDHPDLIVEVIDRFLREMGSSAADLYYFLANHGYRMYLIDWNGLYECPAWHDGLPDQFNALFTTRTSLPSSLRVKGNR